MRGTEEWLRLMKWDGRPGFNYMQHSVYYVNDTVAGIFKQYKNLTQLVVYNAGHLAPYDQGESTYGMFIEQHIYLLLLSTDMMMRFTRGTSFCTSTGVCAQAQCPNTCSNHGKCDTATATCQCQPGWSEEDCSIGNVSVKFGSARTYDGYLFGRGMHVYYVTIPNSPALFDVQIDVQKTTTPYGILHIYATLSNQPIVPNEKSETILLSQFSHSNTEDLDRKTLTMSALEPSSTFHLFFFFCTSLTH